MCYYCYYCGFTVEILFLKNNCQDEGKFLQKKTYEVFHISTDMRESEEKKQSERTKAINFNKWEKK